MMTRITITTLLICLAAFAPGLAQSTTIKVQKGDKFTYNVKAEMEYSELAGGREEMVRAETGGATQLHAARVSKKRIEWTYNSPDVRLRKTTSNASSESSIDTTVVGGARKFATDEKGNILNDSRASVLSFSESTLAESIHRNVVKQWFLPKIFRKMKPGDTWKEQFDDRVAINEMGISLRTRYTVKYVFDGIVDTLGTKALRIRSSASMMSIEGTRSAQGENVPVKGDGDYYGTAYYSTIDGLLLMSNSVNQFDMRVVSIAGKEGSAVPMTWRLKSEAIRQ